MPKFKPTTGYVNIGELFVCNCGIPLARRVGAHDYEIIKHHDNQKTPVKVEIPNGKISCDICGRGFAYITVREHISISDSVHVLTTPASRV